jgi:hypothetical protein
MAKHVGLEVFRWKHFVLCYPSRAAIINIVSWLSTMYALRSLDTIEMNHLRENGDFFVALDAIAF